MLKLNICTSDIINYWVNSNSYYSMQSLEKFINYFFPATIKLIICDNESCDAVIYNIQNDNQQSMDDSKINIMLCVENCNAHKHYKHHSAFGDFGNQKIDIYLYNHIDRCIINERFIAIPVIYLQMNYLKRFYDIIRPIQTTPFSEKKFCLLTCSNKYMSYQKNTIKSFLKSLGVCDDISNFRKDIKNKSCYHSVELMNLFNQYKFIFVSENSITDGYITEKIFNCYFSRSIPIYFGSTAINKYFNSESFININNFNHFPLIKDQINELKTNESLFNKIINTEQVCRNFDDEKYDIKLKQFIQTKLMNKKSD